MAGLTVIRRGIAESERLLSRGQVAGVPRVLNVTDPQWGAVGDGVTDDAAAIQAAINSLLVGGLSKGGTVYFPHTTANYLVKSAILWYSGIQYVGEGAHDSSGTGGSRLIADATGNYANGPTTTGGATGYVLKYNGSATFMHRPAFYGLGVDCKNVAGLGGIWGKAPGENFLLERLRVDNAGSTARSVSDAVTNATTTVTSATAAFTADDVNALVSGTNIPASTKIDQVVSGTQVTLNNAATGSGSGGSLTINRPADAIVFEGTAATGVARSVNGINNAGSLMRLNNPANTGSWVIESLSGDSNGGGLLRVHAGASADDQVSVTVVNFKAENPGAITSMDPIVLLDSCDMVALNILGGSCNTGYNSRDVVRIDQPVTARGGPSVSLVGVEGANPFNTAYTNIIRDTSTGKLFIAAPGNTISGRHFYPNVLWGRDLLIGGAGMIQRPTAAIAQAATVTPDASNGSWQTVTVTTNAALTIAAPPNSPSANNTAELTIEVFNNSGGAMGAITWNATFVFPTGAWANPASTKRRFARFEWNGANWICTSVSSADY